MKLLYLTTLLLVLGSCNTLVIDEWFFDRFTDFAGLQRVADESGDVVKLIWKEKDAADIKTYVLSEMCNMTSDKMNTFNSFILDKNCMAAVETAGEKDGSECGNFKCRLAEFIYEKYPEIVFNLFERPKYNSPNRARSPLKYIISEIAPLLKDSGLCSTCARRFIRALTTCGPSYSGNVMFAAIAEESQYEDTIVAKLLLALKKIDWETVGIILDRVMKHLCSETPSGNCAGSLAKLAKNIETLYYNDYLKPEESCESPRKAHRAAKDIDRTLPYNITEVERQLIMSEKFADVFFCEEKCKKQREIYYPCCLKDIADDKRLKKNIKRAIENAAEIHFLIHSMYDYWASGDIRYHNPGGFRLNPSLYEGLVDEGLVEYRVPKDLLELYDRMVSYPEECGVQCANY